MRRLLTQRKDIPTLRTCFASGVIGAAILADKPGTALNFAVAGPGKHPDPDARGERPNQNRWMIPTPAANWLCDEEGDVWNPSPSVAVALMMLEAPGVLSVLPFAR